jgi:hypothetical protein
MKYVKTITKCMQTEAKQWQNYGETILKSDRKRMKNKKRGQETE